jgi:hypothetical protein
MAGSSQARHLRGGPTLERDCEKIGTLSRQTKHRLFQHNLAKLAFGTPQIPRRLSAIGNKADARGRFVEELQSTTARRAVSLTEQSSSSESSGYFSPSYVLAVDGETAVRVSLNA